MVGLAHEGMHVDLPETRMNTEQTLSWDHTPDSWVCPGCIRRKRDCEVRSKSGKTLRHLVEHHDHMRNYVKDYLVKQYGPWHSILEKHPHRGEFARHIDLIKLFGQRFPITLVCIDCNEVEGKIKQRISADKYFSFHAAELHRALMPAKNERHLFIEEHMPFYKNLYEKISDRLIARRKESIQRLVDAAVNETAWGGPVDLERVLTKDEFERLGRDYPSFDSSLRIRKGLEDGKPVLRGSVWHPHEEAELRRMVNDGIDLEKIARALGRTPTGIRYRMEKLGI